eukprot:2557435-Prymnesium_polylepis.1
MVCVRVIQPLVEKSKQPLHEARRHRRVQDALPGRVYLCRCSIQRGGPPRRAGVLLDGVGLLE